MAAREAPPVTSYTEVVTPPPSGRQRPRWLNLQFVIGSIGTLLIVLVAVVGPFIAPHDPTEIVGGPFQAPGAGSILGTDYLGADVYSRVLAGGFTVVWMSAAATLIGVLLGAVLGLIAGYSSGRVDAVIVWIMDVLLAFPSIVFVLLFVSLLGQSQFLIVVLVAIGWSPVVGRLVRSVTLDTVTQEYVEAVEMMGVPRWRILLRDVLPNIATPLIVQTGAVLTWSIGAIAGLSFLGFGVQAPLADWGLMVNENRSGLTLQPWAALAPVLMIALFTLATNTLGEGVSRSVSGVRTGRAPGLIRRTGFRPPQTARTDKES
ncbi:ABC transporter permease [Leifsonia shinshuensis]|uniref:ABC transporter permease n=1 Tax=Leifsonia shinshuensis TaxID=150026 RepID=A0A7G6YA97_9MICO|nr:ABC transporter permease [Leifsonia shinshuensis]QNE35412.1 ABC transporter permease [Leifsonia shinshuensis]